MPSFLDLLNVRDVQAATHQAVVTQQANNLSVTPKPVLAPIIQQGMANYRAVHALDRAQQRLSIIKNAEQYDRRMQPFAIGLGAADLGISILGGVRARQQAQQREAALNRIVGLEQQGLEQQRQFTESYQDALARSRRSILAPAATRMMELR